MKKRFQSMVCVIVLIFILGSCTQDQEPKPSQSQDENVSEIALLEKELGITFFKEDIILTDESGKNTVTLRVAAKNESMVKVYVETYQFSISPIYKSTDYLKLLKRSNKTEQFPIEEGASEETKLDGVFTEFISKQLDVGVIGLRTNLILKNRSLSGGRIAAPEDFPNNATHYNTSGNWPEIFKMFAWQTVGYKFMKKSKWYSGWSTPTFCDYNNPDICRSYWEHPGERWINVDGPYDVRATVYYFNYTDYSFEWWNDGL